MEVSADGAAQFSLGSSDADLKKHHLYLPYEDPLHLRLYALHADPALDGPRECLIIFLIRRDAIWEPKVGRAGKLLHPPPPPPAVACDLTGRNFWVVTIDASGTQAAVVANLRCLPKPSAAALLAAYRAAVEAKVFTVTKRAPERTSKGGADMNVAGLTSAINRKAMPGRCALAAGWGGGAMHVCVCGGGGGGGGGAATRARASRWVVVLTAGAATATTALSHMCMRVLAAPQPHHLPGLPRDACTCHRPAGTRRS